ncbi:MAG: kynureninase [Haloarculaceae archaeon]
MDSDPLPGFEPTLEYARARDESGFDLRDRFHVPDGEYVDGNSLGPLSVDAERALSRVIEEWRELGIRGWTDADPPWFGYAEYLGDRLAPVVGAREEEVIVANSTTVNIHTLIGTFLDTGAGAGPDSESDTGFDSEATSGLGGGASRGTKVLVNELDFPTDHYAIRAQLRQRGLAPNEHLVVVESRDGRTIEPADVEAALDANPGVGIVFMPSVLYRSGQLFDIARLTRAAHEHGALAGFDLAHSVGVVPHDLADHGVDFAVWCHYKHLNAGPGAIAGLYVNREHFGTTPALAGWWGHEKATQFDMNPTFTPADSAGAWQIGTVPVLAAAPLEGSLDLLSEVGIEAVRERSVALTEFLVRLVDERLPECSVGTPRDPSRRGGHVAVEHPDAYRLCEALRDRGTVVDFRPPDVVRVCPSPYYGTFEEVWTVVGNLREILETGAHEAYDQPSGGVT